MENIATIENQPVQIPIVTCDFASDVSTSEADPGGGSIAMEEKDTLKVKYILINIIDLKYKYNSKNNIRPGVLYHVNKHLNNFKTNKGK